MATRWITALTVLGLFVSAHSDVVYTSGGYDTATSTATPGYETTTTLEKEDERLTCYDCTSYMPACKRHVKDIEEIVSRSGCKSKCFLRVGEEKSGALYRGCMDDFVSAQLRTDYVGCQVQEWNGRKMLWCLCDNNLCNGESLKGIFYTGYGGRKSETSGSYNAPEGKSFEVKPGNADIAYEQILGHVDNINHDYSEYTKHESAVEEPVYAPPKTDIIEKEATPVKEEITDTEYESAHPETPKRSVEPLPPHSQQPYLPAFHPHGYPNVPVYPRDPKYFHGHLPYHYPHNIPYPNRPHFHPHFPLQAQHKLTEGDSLKPGSEKGAEGLLPKETNYDLEGQWQSPGYYYKPEGKVADVDTAGKDGHKEQYQSFSDAFDIEPLTYFPYEEKTSKGGKPEPYVEEVDVTHDQTDMLVKSKTDVAGYTEEEADPEMYCPDAGIFTYEEDCSKFVMCLMDTFKGKPKMYIMQCPSGLVFDNQANTCMKPAFSNGCKRLPPSSDFDESETTPSPENKAFLTTNVVHGTKYEGEDYHFKRGKDEGVIQNLDYDYLDNTFKAAY